MIFNPDEDYRIFKDGDQWCCVGPGFINLQESPAGFGPTPQTAVEDLLGGFVFVPTYTVAHLNWEGDGITALYEGDALLMEGDYYHDKIDDKIEGFFQGLDHQGADYGRQDIYVSGDDFDDCNAPSGLDELKESYPWTEEAE